MVALVRGALAPGALDGAALYEGVLLAGVGPGAATGGRGRVATAYGVRGGGAP